MSRENVEDEEVTKAYRNIKLSPEQKKQLHFILVRVQDLEDVKALAKISFDQIADLVCCEDPNCLCGSSIKPLKQRLADEAALSLTHTKLKELKDMTHAVVQYTTKIDEIKEKVGVFYRIDENRKTVNDLRELLHSYKQRIRDLFFELHIVE